MNLVADEGVDRPVVERLRRDGHEVIYVAEISLVHRQRRVHAGVVLLRLAGISNVSKAALVAEVCRDRAGDLVGAFTVIAPGQVRIRQRA